MSPEEQRALAVSSRGKGEEFMEGMNPKQQETSWRLNNPQQVVDIELFRESCCARSIANVNWKK